MGSSASIDAPLVVVPAGRPKATRLARRSEPQVIALYQYDKEVSLPGRPSPTHRNVAGTANWHFHLMRFRVKYGCHHSKYFLLFYPTGVRVVVHTANLIMRDWSYKSQGAWVQVGGDSVCTRVFPPLPLRAPPSSLIHPSARNEQPHSLS